MSEEKRKAVTSEGLEVSILAGPALARTIYDNDLRERYWAIDPDGVSAFYLASKLTFPPKAEDFENIYPIGGFISGRHRTKGGADISASSGRIAILHRWQDQDGQWHAELLNDE